MAHRTFTRAVLFSSTLLAGMGAGTLSAQAGGILVHEQSTYFQGTSFAGAAANGPALSSMFWNPATITGQGRGLSSETNATVIFSRSEISPLTANAVTGANLVPLGPSGDIAKDAFVPASYYTYGWNEWLTFGLALNSPFGLVTEPRPTWAGMFYSRKSDVFTINANPNVAVKINDWLSVGVGAQVQYIRVKLHSAFPGSGVAAAFPDTLTLEGDSIDAGFTAGITITPTPWTSIGIGYRSRIDHSLEGDIFRPTFTTIAPPPLPPVPVTVPFAFVNFSATVPLPDIATASIRQKITETFTLLGTVEWTNWSRLGTIPIATFPVAPDVARVPGSLPFEWRDGWLFSIGGEYQYQPNLLLRAGIGFERSPVDDRVRGTRLPDNDRLWVSAGATYNWNERLALEIAYSHVFVDSTPINIVPGNPLFNPLLGTFVGTADSQIDILSVALRYRWAPAAPAPAVVRKG